MKKALAIILTLAMLFDPLSAALGAATGELVAQCIDRGLTLETLPLEDYRAVCDLFDQDVYHKINLDTCVATRISEGGPCPESVERQIGKVQAFLDKYPL